ncbi:MAG: hypothetical protein NVS4B12_14710 [Ktedonobacteraceae bacterium]
MSIIDAVVQSFQVALALLFSFVPRLLGFLIILLVGYIVASAIAKAVTFLLRKVGFDRFSTRIGLTRLESQMGVKLDAAGILGRIVYWFIFLIFLVPAVDSLGLASVSALLGQVVAYIPNVFVAILILFLGTLAATFVADIVRGATSGTRIGNPSVFANIARYAILGFVAIVALEQLNIGSALLNILFTAIMGATALAFGLAFGLGGRDAAKRFIESNESSLGQAASQISAQQNAQQSINQARTVADMQTDEYRNRQYTQQPNYQSTTPQQYPPQQYPQQ